jgi:hypothetical protein
MSVGPIVDPSNAMIHQVRKNNPNPQTMAQVSANALMLSFIYIFPFIYFEPSDAADK